MTYIVFWQNKLHVGHVALYLSDTEFFNIPSDYVSFGPDNKTIQALNPFSSNGEIGRFRKFSYNANTREISEKNEFKPRIYEIYNLDIQAMREMYKTVVEEHPRYNLFGNNCAAIAKKILLAGGLRTAAPSVQSHWKNVIASNAEKFKDASGRIPGDYKGSRLFELLVDLSEYISPQLPYCLRGRAKLVGANVVLLGEGAQFLRNLTETPGSLEALIRELGGQLVLS